VFDHLTIRVADLPVSRRFYERVFETLEFGGEPFASDAGCEWDDFSIAPPDADHPVARRLHVVFAGPPGVHVEPADPDGNTLETIDRRGGGGTIDHVRLHTRDAAVARRFYETIAPVVGTAAAAVSLVSGEPPTEHVHLAFGVADNGAVDEFHRIALAAGYRDNGAPGERPEYHPGYYGAYVLDPDGHNVEAVCHNRN
jgi:catechol 2,3-dioxygenase-like lactoylglutathione lyase family enzyme